MVVRAYGTLLALALGISLASAAAAQERPTIAVMPTQYFSADAQSAESVTQALMEQFRTQGYTVIEMDRSRETFEAMNLEPNRHYPDRTAVEFGRRIGADLVAYPQLLALGIPAAAAALPGNETDASAVIHLRVVNANSNGRLYSRQIGTNVDLSQMTADAWYLPQGTAMAAATDLTRPYFERVAGSRQEFRGSR